MPRDAAPSLKAVRMHLGSSLGVRDVISMPDYVQDGQAPLARSANRDSMSEHDYIGVDVAASAPLEALKKEVPVLMEFRHTDGTADTATGRQGSSGPRRGPATCREAWRFTTEAPKDCGFQQACGTLASGT